jgi:hypothetical protein
MRKLLTLLSLFLLSSVAVVAQTIGSTKTEQYKASFETKVDISQYLEYRFKYLNAVSVMRFMSNILNLKKKK